MKGTVSPIRRRPPPANAIARAAGHDQRTTSPGDAGTTGRHTSLVGHHPARYSLTGPGSNFPDPGYYPSQRGLLVAVGVAWGVAIAGMIVVGVFL